MLVKENKLIFKIFVLAFMLSFGCAEKEKEHDLRNKSTTVVGELEYNRIYNLFNDTLQVWKLNKIFGSDDSTYSILYLDSLLCFNKAKTRIVSCILNRYVYKKELSVADGIFYFYGEKIDNKWFFFKGNYIHIPRELVKNHDIHIPLSYQQLHQIALKQVYGGYLKNNGEINEAWFTSHFENAGWCGTCKTTEDFQKSRLENIKTLWLQRDTSQPIKQLPPRTAIP